MKLTPTLFFLSLIAAAPIPGGSTAQQQGTSLQNVQNAPSKAKKKKKKTARPAAATSPNVVNPNAEQSPNSNNNTVVNPNNGGTVVNPGGNNTQNNPQNQNQNQTQIQPNPNNGNNGVDPGNGGNNQTVTDKDIQNKVTPIVEKKDNGSINWTGQYIEATGATAIDTERFKNKAQAKLMATRGAVVVAQRNLLEIVQGVNVTGETTVKDMLTTSDYVLSRVEGVVKGAQQVGEAIEQDGMVTVRLRMPIYATNGLAPALTANAPNTTTDANTSGANTASGTAGATGSTGTQTGTTTGNLPNNGGELVQDVEKILVNLGGKKFNPSMFPVITDDKGNILLDMKKIYDPKTGQFPQIIQASKELLTAIGNKKGVQIVDAVQNELSTGKIVLSSASKSKINWAKIGTTAAQIGKILLMFI